MKSAFSVPRYLLDELKQALSTIDFKPLPPQKTTAPVPEKKDFPPADIEPIVEGCAWMRHCQDDAETLPEPEWYAMLSVLGRCEDGEELAHEWSRPYPGYNPAETDKKLRHALEDAGPVTCQRVWDLTGGVYCRDCEWWQIVGSPITIGTGDEDLETAEKAVQEAIETGTPGKVFEKKVIEAFRNLMEKDAASYARLKQELRDNLKRKFSVRDFETAVRRVHLRVVKEGEKEKPLDETIEGLPGSGLHAPAGFSVRMNGVWQHTKDGGKLICPTPVAITRRFQNVDTGDERLEVAFHRDGRWNRIITERSTLMNRSSIVKLADRGLLVNSETAKAMVKYLAGFEATNMDLPLVKSVSHLGWVGDTLERFLPGYADDVELDVTGSVAAGFRTKGTTEEWSDKVKPIRNFPIARFMLAASFASPLLRVIGHRVFLVYAYGGTRGGKTAALKVALSAWGNPERIMTTFNSTRNALERRAAFFSDLPVGIDERQVVGDKQGFVESVTYMLGSGQSRGRSTRDGRLQEEQQWSNIILATGEEPLSDDRSAGGIKTRVLEIYGRPIDDEIVASQMHEVSGEVYGVAGPYFIRRVIAELEEDPDTFKRDFKAIRNQLRAECPNNIESHISAVAAVLLGDAYSGAWLFGVEEERAVEEAIRLGTSILKDRFEKKSDVDDALRAYEAFLSWFNVHRAYFGDDTLQRYGWTEGGMVCIFPTVFQQAMKELGFNERRIRQDWAERGWIETEMRGGEGKRRTAVRKWDKVENRQVSVVVVKLRKEETT